MGRLKEGTIWECPTCTRPITTPKPVLVHPADRMPMIVLRCPRCNNAHPNVAWLESTLARKERVAKAERRARHAR
jgi:hypothetical protein